jgi:hypothetical protein
MTTQELIDALRDVDRKDKDYLMELAARELDKLNAHVKSIDTLLQEPRSGFGDSLQREHERKIGFMLRWQDEIMEVANRIYDLDGCCHWEGICDHMEKEHEEIERLQRHIFMLENSTSSEVITLQSERDEAREFARFLWSGYYDGQGIDYDNLEDIEMRLPWLGPGGSALKGD